MGLQPGDKCYFIVHPYYHYIGEVVEVLGVRRVSLKNVIQIHSDTRSWTTFFARGITKEANYDVIGESPDLGYLVAHRWPHAIPLSPKEKRS